MLCIYGQREINNLDISSIQNVNELRIVNVSNIPECKFKGLTNLRKVEIENVKSINAGAFMNCENLEKLSIIKNPMLIDDFAFYNTKINFIPDFYKNIKFGAYNNVGENIDLEDISWVDLGKLAKLGKCQKYFNVGDEKTIEIGDKICRTQIYGFEHDNLINTDKKANVTFGFKDLIMTSYTSLCSMSFFKGRYCWRDSFIHYSLNNNTFEMLPVDLQSVIRRVSKTSDIKYDDKTILVNTHDKLFLPSFEEVGFTSSNDKNFTTGQGIKYSIFSDDFSRVKYRNTLNNWWLRSMYSNNMFYCVKHDGTCGYASVNDFCGIAPCFCI